MEICQICGKSCTDNNGLGHHITKVHKITIKSYYDMYYKKENEDICDNDECDNKTTFYSLGRGYAKYCSIQCMNKSAKHKADIENTKTIKYKDKNYNNRQKYEETMLKKYDCRHNWTGDVRKSTENTWIEKYGVDNPWKTKQVQEKCKESFAKNHNGKKTPFQISEIQKRAERLANTPDSKRKANKTREKNNHRSKYELYFRDLLDLNNIQYIEEYSSSQYPYLCDFYLINLDTYIELNMFWMHGKHMYNKKDKNDRKILMGWKEKAKFSKAYKSAINIWTKSDVKKAQIAQQNKLNYKCFFTKAEIDDFILNLGGEVDETCTRRYFSRK